MAIWLAFASKLPVWVSCLCSFAAIILAALAAFPFPLPAPFASFHEMARFPRIFAISSSIFHLSPRDGLLALGVASPHTPKN